MQLSISIPLDILFGACTTWLYEIELQSSLKCVCSYKLLLVYKTFCFESTLVEDDTKPERNIDRIIRIQAISQLFFLIGCQLLHEM